MVCKAILCRLALLLFTFSGVKSQLFDPPTLGRISNNYFGSRTSYAVKPQPSRQQSNPRHGKPVATDQIGDQETRDMINSFLARESRNSFIAKVYGILAAQLIFTALSVTVFGTNPAIKRWILGSGLGIYAPLVCALISLCTVLVMTFSTHARRSSPLKYNLLALFTFGEAISVGFVTSFYKFRSVVTAMLATALATTAISVYTVRQKNPRYDLTQWGAALSSCGLVFVTLSFVKLLQSFGTIPTIIPLNDSLFAFLGACMFSFYLAHDTRLIVAGKHSKYRMNNEDYVFGAMTLYMDIISLFLQLLDLLADKDNKK
ncbi:uncharacterized protein FisN_5Hu493 [Fistulifera solaris]|uniref:Bax inhibitor 1 n=1 Tax=Fistulifera solaris TaxID=1519565 RepID=A0A1Z5JSV1_FISSO|nr:uncharacterized protein FisN_5Hu493 [Fistulifera solaris]|eukprot:GAX17107.1 uncharacterized protein FisN_5Hu493 [Fistulifera solaris]